VATIQNALIYLFGFSGTGKLSIARELQALMPCTSIDNHFINNVVLSLIDADGKSPLLPAIWEYIDRVRTAVFDTVREFSNPRRNFIFTNELIEGVEVTRRVFVQVAEIAAYRHARFLPVRLLIAPEELARRVASPGRAALHKGTDAAAAIRKTREQVVFIPTECTYVEVDVTARSAGEAAHYIFQEFKKRYNL
jgi:hypothetical protein